jgi:hypothetical protein
MRGDPFQERLRKAIDKGLIDKAFAFPALSFFSASMICIQLLACQGDKKRM